MKALVLKDLRENFKIALIGLLILTLILLGSYQSYIEILTNMAHGSSAGPNNFLQPLLATDLLNVMALFCALFGTALGLLQTRNEAHRDLWAFLVHRPVTSTDIFWGKTIAGVGLYLFGAGLPLMVYVGIVLTPGQVAAPFEWAMIWPVSFIFLTGLAYYFAGMLTGLRQARWYASRALGLGTAIIVSIGTFGLPEFWQQFALIGIAVLILMASAWGAYQSGGYYRGQPVAGKFALALTVTGGTSLLLLVVFTLLFKMVLEPAGLSSQEYSSFSYYRMARDGTIYKEIRKSDQTTDIVEVDERSGLDLKTGRKMDQNKLSDSIAAAGWVYTGIYRYVHHNPLQNYSYFFTVRNVDTNNIWFLDRYGKLTGYDLRTRRVVGDLNATEPYLFFPPSPNNPPSPNILPTAKSVYQVDFTNRTVTPLFTLTNEENIAGFSDEIFAPGMSTNWLVATHKSVYLLGIQGKRILTVPYGLNYAEYPNVEFHYLGPTNKSPERFAVWFKPDYETNRATNWKLPIQIQWVGTTPTETDITSLPALGPPQFIWSREHKISFALQPPIVGFRIKEQASAGCYWSRIFVAAICAAIAWLIGRRYNFAIIAQIGWASFILLTGIAGLLTFLCVQEWPARVVCPQCKKRRTVDRESCEHCEAPFPPPEKNGTEIFVPLEDILKR